MCFVKYYFDAITLKEKDLSLFWKIIPGAQGEKMYLIQKQSTVFVLWNYLQNNPKIDWTGWEKAEGLIFAK